MKLVLVLSFLVLGVSRVRAAVDGRCNAVAPCACDEQNRLTCDCKNAPGEELILTTEGVWNLSRHIVRIYINNCLLVHLANNSLIQMDQLNSIEFTNVRNLTLIRESFKLSPKASKTRISVTNSSIDVLPGNVFHGNVEAITFKDVKIGQVAPFAFANLLSTDSVTLNHCEIKSIESQAFKKFETSILHVIGGNLGDQVPSRTMMDIEVTDSFMLDSVKIGNVSSSAFAIKGPSTVVIVNCTVESLASEAFDLVVRGSVVIRNNTFENLGLGVFLAIRTDSDSKIPSTTNILNPKNLIFKDNVLSTFEEGSLVFDRTSFRIELSNVLVNQICDCEQIKTWKSQILNYTNPHSRLLPSLDTGPNIVAAPFTLESGIDDPDAFFCLDDRESGSTSSFVAYETHNCVLGSSMLALVLSISGLLALILVAASIVVYCCRRRHRDDQKRWISVPTTAPDIVSKTKNGVIGRDTGGSSGNGAGGGAPVDSRITMVVPDGRLYRETEFHVIVEKAEPLTTEL